MAFGDGALGKELSLDEGGPHSGMGAFRSRDFRELARSLPCEDSGEKAAVSREEDP